MAGLTINPRKCAFEQQQVEYLGHVVGQGVIKPRVGKVDAIQAYPVPTTKKKVRSFMCLVAASGVVSQVSGPDALQAQLSSAPERLVRLYRVLQMLVSLRRVFQMRLHLLFLGLVRLHLQFQRPACVHQLFLRAVHLCCLFERPVCLHHRLFLEQMLDRLHPEPSSVSVPALVPMGTISSLCRSCPPCNLCESPQHEEELKSVMKTEDLHRILLLLLLLLLWTMSVSTDAAAGVERPGRSQRRGGGGGGEKRRRLHRIQHGQCSYTFVLPEVDGCQSGGPPGRTELGSVAQRDSPPPADGGEWSAQKLRQLERTMANNTQWLQKLENFIQKNMRREVSTIQSDVVHNQTAAMLQIGTNLLTHTAEQTRKLNMVETQVLNHTSRIEIQLLENSLSTNKLEKELLLQTTEISRLRDKNSHLETKVQMLESQQRGELEDMRQEKTRLQTIIRTQMFTIESLETQLRAASGNASVLQRQQVQLMESVHTLITMVTAAAPHSIQMWRDCADIYKAGHSVSGLYHIYISNRTDPVQVFCDMDTSGGGWTVFQRRFNGTVDFQRSWGEYKLGFGDILGEHWLGNEVLHLISSQGQYSLRVELEDWEGNSAHFHYDRFTLTSERQQYRLYLRGYSSSAGRQSSLSTHGTGFSTQDRDHDNCDHCRCALMLTGGWWFDACGFSNLNGIYYTVGHNIRKLNGIKWHHFRGPSYSLRSTAMMVRPYDF
ncbi:angiopoietin-4 [Pholidichthys leucotaenia]